MFNIPKRLTVGEKYERWRIQKNVLEADEEQAFCAGHVAGAQLRSAEADALHEKLDFATHALELLMNDGVWHRDTMRKHVSETLKLLKEAES